MDEHQSTSTSKPTRRKKTTSRQPSSSSSRKRPFDSISNPVLEDDSNSTAHHHHHQHQHQHQHQHPSQHQHQYQHQHQHQHPHHHHHHHHHPQNPQQPLNNPTNNQFSNHHLHSHHSHHPHQQNHPQMNPHHNPMPLLPPEEDFPMIRCGWNDCRQGFWILEDLINHLVGENGHVPPDPTAPRGQKCPCEWTGCPKQGKPQGSRMALLVHLRSHTGEKPFSCHKPECDKTFSRTDALAKHVRVSHGEILQTVRSSTNPNPNPNVSSSSSGLKLPPNTNQSGQNHPSGKKIKAENESEEEENEESNQLGGADRTQASNCKPEKELIELINENGKCFNEFIDAELRTEEERKSLEELKAKLPSNDFAFLEFLVLKAKIKFALGEREIMKSELNLLKLKEENLNREKDSMLDELMKNKIGMESCALWRSTIDTNAAENADNNP